MVYVIRDGSGDIVDVFGYFSIADVKNYCSEKYPDKSMRWELSIPKDYTGEVTYLPEKKLSVSDLPSHSHNV